MHDNIIPKPDLALELGKSISLTEAEEEAVAREVHATHARIMSGPDPEPMQEDQTGSNSGKLHVSLAGPNPEHMDDEFLVTAYPKVHENLKLITDERVIEENPESHSGSMSSMKNLDDTYNFGDQFLYDKLTEDDQEKSKVIEESDSTIPDPSHQTVTSTPPVIAPFTNVSSTKPSSLLRVARLEQEMCEVKKTNHSADVLASIKSQVPTVVDKYLGTKFEDALLKILERHTADLNREIPCAAWPRQKQYHSTPDSAVHHTGDDFILGNLKLSQKVRTDEVILRKPHKKVQREQPATKRALPKKEPTQTTNPVKPSKPVSSCIRQRNLPSIKLPQKVRKRKAFFHLLMKMMKLNKNPFLKKKLSLDPAFLPQGRAPVGGVTIRDPVSETTPKLPEVVGKGKAIVTEEQVAHSLIDLSKKKRNTDQFILVRQAAAPKGDKDQGEVDSSRVTSGVSIPVSTQGQAGSDTEKAHEALAGPDPEPMQEDQTGSDSGKVHVSLAGPNQENMDDEFLATAYPKVHENLKLITDERVIEDNPESHSGSIHQTVTSTPLVIAPVTDFSSPKPSSLVTPPPINTEATNCFAFRDSFILSKKRSSDSSKKLKGIQTLTPAKQEAADIMKALKESKKMSKRQPGTGGSNEGTGNILGVPDESTIVSRASSEGTGSKPGVPDEEMLILEWEADVDSEHFDRDDNAGDDNEETKPDPEEIYK
ncbi:hypothetical protein Tco_0877028 [Tanacetum coccineum]|uniref:Uncharacterized protein n=1 Tax=Tanacetum coccineum TaxID=301880 RepID=A0ABQ5BWL4_9ASTR